MLLRSSSMPIRNSSLMPEHESVTTIHRSVSVMATGSYSTSSPLSISSDESAKKMTKSLSDTDLKYAGKEIAAVPKRKPVNTDRVLHGLDVSLREEDELSDCKMEDGEYLRDVLVEGGIGSGGGKKCGDGGRDGGRDGGGEINGDDSTDLYYRKMIEANPGNALLLSNYAKFLKEARADFVKAEEYCSRAILVNPNDGNILSMYAGLIWERYKDAPRAESYFDQAVKASPDDSYVIASYARFLWDTEEDEDEEDNREVEEMDGMSPPSFLRGVSPPTPPLATAS